MDGYCVGIVGSGLMGRGIAHVLSMSNCISKIYWKAGRGADLSISMLNLKNNFDLLVRKRRLDVAAVDGFLGKFIECKTLSELSECDIVHETILECEVTKKKIIYELSSQVKKSTIIASNTSSLSITELGCASDDPSRVIGMHFFNPAPVMKLVEVVSGVMTDSAIADIVVKYSESIGKTPVRVKDSPGFIVNRLLMPMINEAVCLLADEISDRDSIDQALKFGANHPIGPLALADLIGNDVVLSIMEVLYRGTGDKKYRPHPYLRKMVRTGRLGKKSGCGFYSYGMEDNTQG